MFGTPKDVDGQCNAHLYLGDDYGDNTTTIRCQLQSEHEGRHQEEYTRKIGSVLILWDGDDRLEEKKEDGWPGSTLNDFIEMISPTADQETLTKVWEPYRTSVETFLHKFYTNGGSYEWIKDLTEFLQKLPDTQGIVVRYLEKAAEQIRKSFDEPELADLLEGDEDYRNVRNCLAELKARTQP